jgi:hypothetical protein
MDKVAFLKELKRAGREVDHLPPSNAEVKTAGTLLPPPLSWSDA